jgi:hypothetical protein
MRHIVTAVAMIAALLATGGVSAEDGSAHASTPPAEIVRPAHFKLVDAAPSVDALIGRLLDALAANDADALHRLRVTEDEYRQFILPGSAKPGEKPQVFREEESKHLWGMLNTHSQYAAKGIINKYGGHRYRLKETEFAKGEREYAWYKAYKVVDLTLEDETGTVDELVLGSIANVDGQFKFISLLGNL